MKRRASDAPTNAKCAASAWGAEDTIQIHRVDEYSQFGSAVHEAGACIVRGELFAADEIMAKHGLGASEMGRFLHAVYVISRWWREYGPIFTTDDGTLRILDWKTTRLLDVDYSPQCMEYLYLGIRLNEQSIGLPHGLLVEAELSHGDLSGHPDAMFVPARIERCQYMVVFLEDGSQIVSDYLQPKQVMELHDELEHRILEWNGRDYHPGGHCFGGETRFLTIAGVRSLADACDETVTILNRYGQWEKGEVKWFGSQTLYRVRFNDGTSVRTTADHRWWKMVKDAKHGWIQSDERIRTIELDRVPLIRPIITPSLENEGIRHGIVFGDGYLRKERGYSTVRLQPHKAELAKFFSSIPTVRNHRSVKHRTNGIVDITVQPDHFKKLPDTYTPSYARGFIAGLIATDGSVNRRTGGVTLSCEGYGKALRIAEIARIGGVVVTSVRIESTQWPKVMPGGKQIEGKSRELCSIRMKPGTCPIISERQKPFLKKTHQLRGMYRTVVSIEPDGWEDVFCLSVPGSESFTLANGIATSNCWYCRRAATCPGIRHEIAQCASPDIERIQDAVAMLDDPACVDLWDRIGMRIKFLERARECIKLRAASAGDKKLVGTQRDLVLDEQKRQSIKPVQAWPILMNYLTETELAPAVSISKTVAMGAISAKCACGQKKATTDKVLAELEAAGALEDKTILFPRIVPSAAESNKILPEDGA